MEPRKKEGYSQKNFLHARIYHQNIDALNRMIQKRAYEIWKKEGMPKGKDFEIWLQAEREVKQMQKEKIFSAVNQEKSHGNEKEEMERENIMDRLNTLEIVVKELTEKVMNLQEQQKRPAAAQTPSAAQPAAEKIPEPVENKCVQASEDAGRLQKRVRHLENVQEVMKERIKTLEYRKEELTRDIECRHAEREKLLAAIDALRRDLENSFAPEERKNYEEVIRRTQKEKEALESAQQESQEILKSMQDELRRLTEETGHYQERMRHLEDAQTLMKDKISVLENEKKEIIRAAECRQAEREEMLATIDSLKRDLETALSPEERKKYEELIQRVQREKQEAVNQLNTLRRQLELGQSESAGALKEQGGLLTQAREELQRLRQNCQTMAQENERLLKQAEGFERERRGYLAKMAELAKLSEVSAERQRLQKRVIELEQFRQQVMNNKKDSAGGWKKGSADGEETALLLARVKELEAERVKLFQTITGLEEKNKSMMPLEKKNYILQEEITRTVQENKLLQHKVDHLEKEQKSLREKMEILESKRSARLVLEQEKGGLQKRISGLERERNAYIEKIDELEKKYGELNAAVSSGSAASDKGKDAQAQKLSEMEEVRRKMQEEINLLRKKLEEEQPAGAVGYLLDKDKLAELKDFTLTAIQERTWKNNDFVNGAYDAVSLFYRSIIADRPLKKTKPE